MSQTHAREGCSREIAERRGSPPAPSRETESDSHIHQLGRLVHPHGEAVLALRGHQQLLHRGAHRLHPGAKESGGQHQARHGAPRPLPAQSGRPQAAGAPLLTSVPRCRTPRALPVSCCSYNPQWKTASRQVQGRKCNIQGWRAKAFPRRPSVRQDLRKAAKPTPKKAEKIASVSARIIQVATEEIRVLGVSDLSAATGTVFYRQRSWWGVAPVTRSPL